MIMRQLLGQTRRDGDDLAAIKFRLDRVEQKVDGVASERQQFAGHGRRACE